VNIALDFDNTLTADPVLWSWFANKAKDLGHTVTIVTARRDTEENRDDVKLFQIEHGVNLHTVFTNLRSKLEVCAERGMKIDIWIDDDPTSLVRGH